MVVSIQTEPQFTAEKPVALFAGSYGGRFGYGNPNYDVTPDGQRFVMLQPVQDESATTQVHVVLNWFQAPTTASSKSSARVGWSCPDSSRKTPLASAIPSSREKPVAVTRQDWLLLAESHLTKRLFGAVVRRIAALPLPSG